MSAATLKRTVSLGAFAVLSLGATAIDYQYTGNGFTTAFSPYTTSDFVAVELDFAQALDPNLSLVDVTGLLTGWSVTDQVQNFSSTLGSTLDFAVLSTDSSGNIDQWQIVSCDVASDCNSSTNTVATYNLPTTVTDVGVTINDIEGTHGTNSDSPGSWSATELPSAPEPAGALLAGAGCGLIGVFAFLRRS